MRCGIQCEPLLVRVCSGESMYAIAPGAGDGNSWVAYPCSIRAPIAARLWPASTNSVCFNMAGRTVLAAAELKQCGARTCGSQKSGSFNGPPNERNTAQVKPLLPCAPSTKPVRRSTSTVAESEMALGAALRASATSAAPSAMRYGPMSGTVARCAARGRARVATGSDASTRAAREPNERVGMGDLPGGGDRSSFRLQVPQKVLEPVEALLPLSAELLEVGVRLLERLGLERARAQLAVSRSNDESGPLQHVQVLRDRRLGHVEWGDELADRVWSFAEALQYGPSRGIGEGTENGAEVVGGRRASRLAHS